MATSALLEQQKRLDPSTTPLKLVQDVQTRWNSSYMMMKRLMLPAPCASVWRYYGRKCHQGARQNVSDAMWRTMEQLVPISEPFTDVTEVLGSEEVPTSSGIYVLLPTLVSQLAASPLDSSMTKGIKNSLKKGLMKRFLLDDNRKPTNESITDYVAIMSLFLDPRYKSLKGA